ncbi:RHS repeat-associated core domain-containing protein [Chryseobacterium bernardetii]|uniref:RHS repeat-associated core domain-containing protein n=1 Tax=Chryseobacterium bernardetii TaxID=1241978 RepID=A0A3G6T4L3_9FLAO|nr:DUF6443 domain-containing protein [Chryseobacterium bernardetii]AZB24292.1 RHS repeat-associated core domain-containing protein [Chryseobacterium bernardetii]
MRKIIILIKIFTCIGVTYAQSSPSTEENYIQEKKYLEPVNVSSSTAKQINKIQYFNRLGAPKQTINVKGSPKGRDIVKHIEYDNSGRKIKNFLPVPQSSTQNGAIYSSPLSNATDPEIYGSEKIYSETVIENSPLNRIKQEKPLGIAWDGKSVQFGYDVNIFEDYVRKYETITEWDPINKVYKSSVKLLQYYDANQLYKNTIIDEDGNKSIKFKNSKEQIILVRKILSSTENADTYYVYDDYDRLVYVIPPLASAPTVEPSTLEKLYYEYKYDNKGRLVEKKIPGKGWEYIIYDKQNRKVLTQDPALRTLENSFKKKGWLFNKYDKFGRIVYTGFFANTSTRVDLQTAINNMTANPGNNEERSTAPFSINGMDVYYTKNAFPTESMTILSINYYDTYQSYSFNPVFPSSILGANTLTDNSIGNILSTKNLPVMSFVKNIEDDSWTKNYTYYDNKARIIGTHSINHLGGYTKTESRLDFVGVVQTVITKHKRLETDQERVITENFEYDNQNRLLVHKHQVDANAVEILTQNKYNELTQLESKKIGGTDIINPLQTVDYRYNIRGWLTKINDPSNLNGKLFGYEIKYNNPLNSTNSPGRFNGNIAEIDWRNSSEDILKRYNYQYDSLNRLKNGFYSEPNATNPANGNFDEYLTYDLNGNINTLKRNAIPVSGGTSTLVDNLEYKYTGNRLNQVIESAMNDAGYEGGNNMIDYDANGNMTTMNDKGIYSIVYNYLNLPNSYSIQDNKFGLPMYIGLSYLYRADGTKLRKIYSSRPVRGSTSYTTTDYLDGFQYTYREGDGICITCRTESAFEQQAYGSISKVFPDLELPPRWILDFVPTAEGFYSFTENRYIYQYKDHLDNARVSFAKNSAGVLEVTDTNDYYPFGLNHISGMFSLSNFGGLYSYKYNGKELQETGMYDYGARFYMPDLGRWSVIDPRSQYTHEAYSYVWNNPIKFADPTGMQGELIGKCPPECPEGVSAINVLPSGESETQIQEITFTGQAGNKNSGPGSLAMMALYVSQVDSPAPGPADIVAAVMLATAGVWWTYNHLSTPTTGYTTIADPGAGYGSMKTEDAAEEDVNGTDVPQEDGENSLYESKTGKRAVNNRETNISQGEFEKNLEESGFEKTTSSDGERTTYSKDGKSYTVRRNSKEGSPTADFRKSPDGKGKTDIKIRLKP